MEGLNRFLSLYNRIEDFSDRDITRILWYCGYTFGDGVVYHSSIGRSFELGIGLESVKMIYEDVKRYPVFGMLDLWNGLTLERLVEYYGRID